MQLRTPGGQILTYCILQTFPFTSESKRMGVIVRVRWPLSPSWPPALVTVRSLQRPLKAHSRAVGSSQCSVIIKSRLIIHAEKLVWL
ncbi:hypothetical protein E2I00_017668 [Balaenoptera physalus]|uniref:Uncharacterized protein n=1 Tax=Balaenoptera physalus TaxID=9770 RepID=A0A643CFJ8_BALPH|nr:hypothetical protein E2I00_017668 [Balaenoptera physalus]